MTIQEAINIRTSRRTYIKVPLEEDQIEKLQLLINDYNQIGGFRIKLIINNNEAFKGFTRSYGMLTNVCHYFAFIADKHDPYADEKIGYYGELLVLHCTTLCLGTCWVGGTFSKSKIPFSLTPSEKLSCIITVGKVADIPTGKEAFIYKMTHRKTKNISELYNSDTIIPEWFSQGMEAVIKAPSAMNKQPIMFHYQNGSVTANIHSKTKYLKNLDLGIAKLHFELGAGGGTWEWKDGGKFMREEEK